MALTSRAIQGAIQLPPGQHAQRKEKHYENLAHDLESPPQMQDWKAQLKRVAKQLEKPRKPPNPRVWVLAEAIHEFAKMHYAHNRVAKPIRY
jgi:hypothetical protein